MLIIGTAWSTVLKSFDRLAADALGGRIGRQADSGCASPDRSARASAVIFLIADLRARQHVVLVIVMIDRLAKLLDLLLNGLAHAIILRPRR